MTSQDSFKDDIKNFISISQNISREEIKKEYYNLVKKYHPDMYTNNKSQYDKYMMILNHLYSNIKTNSKTETKTASDEYEKMKVNGKYTFINRDKKPEHVLDKSLFLYKMGLDKIFWSRDYLCAHPLSEGFGDEIVIKISQALYLAIKYLTDSIKLGKNNNWINEAKEKIQWAYEMNSRITRNLYDINSNKAVGFSLNR
ncbi:MULTISPECIES: J domain-containing protein [unclassified Treponema]|uniref:J domain-containing protein n=1 Tax=unclassified Treponema TaxID=2638727 RepID=UPI0020A2D2FA|nr:MULTISPECIES: J domain-containing protein [unclassified Treponema]UTC67383.1 J domain-containing protein [Treponema sp. OMZ 789]UTC70111.1 J domain-containing protein [Treponema sp. OMZ 790]UTC72826.1 J domain-containing protein [Treponema sp. OMZ 791]